MVQTGAGADGAVGRDRLGDASVKAGRDPAEIAIMAVTKGFPRAAAELRVPALRDGAGILSFRLAAQPP